MIIGLTGGICSGKSTASAALRGLGLLVLDCDDLARHLTDFEPEIRAALRSHWPLAFAAGGALNRRQLAETVFADAAARRQLEQILHPPILDNVRRNVACERAASRHLVIVVPLLFELGLQSLFDATWLITCEPAAQLARLMQRSGLSADQAGQWIAAQWPLERKLPLASLVLHNNAKIEDLQAAVQAAWEGELKAC